MEPSAENAAASSAAPASPPERPYFRNWTPEYTLVVLARLHYLLGALTTLSALTWLPAVLMAYNLLYHPELPLSENQEWVLVQLERYIEWVHEMQGTPMPNYDRPLWGAVLLIMFVPIVTLFVMHGFVLAYIGRLLATHRRRTLCLIFSVFNMMNMPLGTILSVWTYTTLRRKAVTELFAVNDSQKKAQRKKKAS